MARLNFALERASDAGVECLMSCGSSEEDWQQVADLSPSRPLMLRSFGLHPWYVKERSPKWKDNLVSFLRGQPSGIGEIGLDHAVENRNDQEEEDVFVAQIEIARELKRPVSIHCRRAWERMLELLAAFGKHAPGIVIHSYSGSAESVKPLAELGVYFSFSGAITRETNERGRAALQVVPLDRLLIETDAPDLMPVLPADETRDLSLDHPVNEPANLVFILHKVAELRQRPPHGHCGAHLGERPPPLRQRNARAAVGRPFLADRTGRNACPAALFLRSGRNEAAGQPAQQVPREVLPTPVRFARVAVEPLLARPRDHRGARPPRPRLDVAQLVAVHQRRHTRPDQRPSGEVISLIQGEDEIAGFHAVKQCYIQRLG